ncbi:MAG TPA: leishmanolysin-related zinc metalloendopeptidase [Gemmatimonadales bacterium]|nr:leishmanolysin-related zinc metalloendopeptidase [Gemmatimonadales bacterium]
MNRVAALALLLVCSACQGSDVTTPSAITLSPAAVSFGALGSTHVIVAAVVDERGDPVRGVAILWSSDDSAVAGVDASGRVRALAVGATKIRATIAQPGAPLVDSVSVSVTQVPAHFLKFAGDLQIDSVSGMLPTPVTIQVTDSNSHPITGIVATFAVTGGGGHVSSAADTSDVTGRASVFWTLGGSTGPNTLSATAATAIPGSPVFFTATAVVAGSGPVVVANAGDAQHGLVGAPLNVAPSVLVKDITGTPLAGQQVTFAVSVGGGIVSGASAVTGVDGLATVGSWTVAPGANALTATVAGPGPIVGNPVTFTATGDQPAYHIDVRVITAMTDAEKAAFTLAAAKWESVIFGDVPDQQVTIASNSCGTGSPGLFETVDDIVIFAIIDSIDGPGKILGQAGPCFVRSDGNLPIVGVMQFDSSDVVNLLAAGSFGLVIQHEMGHVLGFGTLWPSDFLLANPSGCDSTQDPHFVGSQGLAAFDRIGGASYVASAKVPVENQGGPGTCDAHWRESVFKNELMTGFLNIGSNPLSLETVASMGDLGYLVTYSAADPYVVPALLKGGQVITMGNDVLRLPVKILDRSGNVVGTLPIKR